MSEMNQIAHQSARQRKRNGATASHDRTLVLSNIPMLNRVIWINCIIIRNRFLYLDEMFCSSRSQPRRCLSLFPISRNLPDERPKSVRLVNNYRKSIKINGLCLFDAEQR